MKHLKLYEGYMIDMFREIRAIQDKYRVDIDACLNELIDDYGLVFDKLHDGQFLYESNMDITVTDEFVEMLLRAEKKVKAYGLYISFVATGALYINSLDYLVKKHKDITEHPEKYRNLGNAVPLVIRQVRISIDEPYNS
jgi:hypothetical protein